MHHSLSILSRQIWQQFSPSWQCSVPANEWNERAKSVHSTILSSATRYRSISRLAATELIIMRDFTSHK